MIIGRPLLENPINLREHFEAIHKDKIAKSSDFSQIEDFYWQVRSGYESVNDLESDSDSSVDLY